MTRVKICGLTSEAALDAALEAGADMVGFVFFPNSPRHVSLERGAALAARARGRSAIVALVVDPEDAELDAIAAAMRPDVFQLHGRETPDRADAIRAHTGASVMKALAVEGRGDAQRAFAYRESADLILFDAKQPPGSNLPGGNGLTFDWSLLDAVRGRVPFVLSGGLTPDNVANAIRATGAAAVDVSSGVESAPGEKDVAKIRAFIRAAKG
jgi:phosphoribosylanthranilate isomerase